MTHTAAPRLFLGLLLAEPLRTQLYGAVSALLDPHDWRLVAAEDLHLTLCFVGEVASEDLPRLRAAVRAELAGASAPQMIVRGFGSFGKPDSPRVLWAGVSATPEQTARVLDLRRAGARALARAALAWDAAAPFTPHITVARPRRRVPLPTAFGAASFEHSWHPAQAALLASVPGGRPHYRPLETVRLVP